MDESKTTEAIWSNAAQYDSDVEHLFTYVQVFTAALSSFAHGANDIANAIAPVAAIISIYQSGELNPEAPVQKVGVSLWRCGSISWTFTLWLQCNEDNWI